MSGADNPNQSRASGARMYGADNGDLSLKLAEILDDIAVNEKMVKKRRYMSSQNEAMMTIPKGHKRSCYIFDSIAEGTTTLGLGSNQHVFWCNKAYNVIQDRDEWKDDANNLLMLHDEAPPGYCRLQILGSDIDTFDNLVRGNIKELLLYNKQKSYCMYPDDTEKKEFVPEMPAPQKADPSKVATTIAYACASWPRTARNWLNEQNQTDWPAVEMKKHCEKTGCFVVPEDPSNNKRRSEFEWRLCMPLAERYLMRTLNITQIRCYVLMKMILKSYINPPGHSYISNYMCKTVLFHSIEETKSDFWQENNLLTCLLHCFENLHHFIVSENCPHFILPENNLMSGMSPGNKESLLSKTKNLVNTASLQKVLLKIPIDHLGTRLQCKISSGKTGIKKFPTKEEYEQEISGQLLLNFVSNLYTLSKDLLKVVPQPLLFQFLSQFLCQSINSPEKSIQQIAANQTAAFLCTTIGSAIASASIGTSKSFSKEALFWFSGGMNSDALSSRLKFASATYCTDDMLETRSILNDLQARYSQANQMCICHGGHMGQKWPINFREGKVNITNFAGVCVKFLPYEKNCVPQEMMYEMFRSTIEERSLRGRMYTWMDWAVVDPLYFLNFLQYKVCGKLKQHGEQIGTLVNFLYLVHCIPYPGHRETALNLLGQCFEQEDQNLDAISCYLKSLEVQGSNNVARWHLCKLIAKLVADRVPALNSCGVSLWAVRSTISREIEDQVNLSQRKTQIQVFTKLFAYKNRKL